MRKTIPGFSWGDCCSTYIMGFMGMMKTEEEEREKGLDRTWKTKGFWILYHCTILFFVLIRSIMAIGRQSKSFIYKFNVKLYDI